MNKYICLLMGAALLAACEQKETTVTNPPAEKTEKKETNTTIVNPSPATKTETKTDINVNTSPSPACGTKDFCCTANCHSDRSGGISYYF